jgi:hypothetical protein
MSTITAIVKTEDHYGICAITCGSKTMSDSLIFIPPNVFGSAQATFTVENTKRVKDVLSEGGNIKDIIEGDLGFENRQYLFFLDGLVKYYTGIQVGKVYENYNDNVVVVANRIGSSEFGDNLFRSLNNHYSEDLVDCLIKSFKENKYVGFDFACRTKNISSTTLYVGVFEKNGKVVYQNEIYSTTDDPIDILEYSKES